MKDIKSKRRIRNRQSIFIAHNSRCIRMHANNDIITLADLNKKGVSEKIAKASTAKLLRSIKYLNSAENKKEHNLLSDALVGREVHMYDHWQPFNEVKMKSIPPGSSHYVLSNRRSYRQ